MGGVSFQDLGNRDLMRQFLFHVKEDRHCRPGTLAGYCVCLNRAVRYLRNLEGCDPVQVDSVSTFLTTKANAFQRDAEAERVTSKEVLATQGKWLDW